MEGEETIVAQERVRRIAARLETLPESKMRAAVFAEWLLELSSEQAVESLAWLLGFGPTSKLDLELCHRAYADTLEDESKIPYEKREDWYRVAHHAGHEQLCRVLLSSPPLQGSAWSRKLPSPIPGRDEVTLGERRSLARRSDRELLERLLLDPDPGVVRNLLANPQVTEEWALRIATQRPGKVEVFKEIVRHPRWFDRYNVRLALARNPFTPTDLSLRILSTLMAQDLREIAEDGTLHETVRSQAKVQHDRKTCS